jgi:hypothetical protein
MKKLLNLSLFVTVLLIIVGIDADVGAASFTETGDLDYSATYAISYEDILVEGEDLEVSFKIDDSGQGVEKLFEIYFVNSASAQIDIAAGIEPTNTEYAVEDEWVTFTINTSEQNAGDYTFQISRLNVEFQGSSETLYPNLEFSYSIQSVPVITLQGNNLMYVEYGSAFNDPGAIATDVEDGDLTGSIVTTGTVDTNTMGNYYINYDVDDSDSNAAATVTRTVIIQDTTNPVITLVGSSSINLSVGDTYSESGATAADNYDGDLTSSIVTSGTVDTSTGGTYTITYAATDSNGNTGQTSRTVNVIDVNAPVITLLGDTVMYVEYGSAFVDPGAEATDETDGDITSSIRTLGSVNTSALGTYTIDYNVIDSSDNNAITKSRTVIVQDNTAPVISLNGLSTVYIEVGTSYSEPGATASDAYDGVLTSSILIDGNVNNAALGTYTVNYEVTDSNGNTGTASRTVIIQDTTNPVITVTDQQTYNSTITPLTELTADMTASDLHDGNLTGAIIKSVDNYTGNETRIGTYTVTYLVTDSSGNQATRTITIAVLDDLPPTITTSSNFIDRTSADNMTYQQIIDHINARG